MGKKNWLRPFVYLLFLFSASIFISCAKSPPVKLDPESQEFYELASLIMSNEENKMFRLLPDEESRREFIREFWEKRDPFPETPENEFQQEFLTRVKYADQRFREGGKGRNTDRGRVYILLGPPDKTDEIFTHDDPSVRGSILLWIYYDHDLGIEFVDEKGIGQYRLREVSGNLFEAMDFNRLGGRFGPGSVFKKRMINFKLDYHHKEKKLFIYLPAKALNFSEDEEGYNYLSLRFVFYIYNRKGQRIGKYTEDRLYRVNLENYLKLKEVEFSFGLDLPDGRGYIDVTIEGRGEKAGRIRKLFDIS